MARRDRRRSPSRKRSGSNPFLERLEKRALLASGNDTFAQLPGMKPVGDLGLAEVRIDPEDFDFAGPPDRMLVGLVADGQPSGSALGPLRVVSQQSARG